MGFRIINTVFILLILSIRSFGGTIRHDIEDSKYIKYGEEHKCVLRIDGTIEEDGKEINYFGSCVALSEKWIVTAAHVVKDSKKSFVIFEKKKIPVEKVVIFPEYTGSFGTTDLAICKLKEKIELDFYPRLYEEQNEIGKICGIAGYGRTGTGLSGAKGSSDGATKRAGSNKIDAISEGALYCEMSKLNPTELEFLISHGDSGGGLFIDGKLAGINSSVLCKDGITDSNYGDESCHTRISKYVAWIKKAMSED